MLLGICAAMPAYAQSGVGQSGTTNTEQNAASAGGGGGGGASSGAVSTAIPTHQTTPPSAMAKADQKNLENGPPARAAANSGAQ